MWYGATTDDWSRFANMADATKVHTTPYPQIESVNDGEGVPDHPGRYAANAWGLKDMHGNVAVWTSSTYATAGISNVSDEKVVRGGSWCDRPFRCTSSFRLPYHSWQRVFNVGFRVVMEDE